MATTERRSEATEPTIKIRRPGSTAKLGDIEVTVLAAHIRTTGVDYTVSWITDGSRKSDTVEAFELSDGEHALSVGFKWVG